MKIEYMRTMLGIVRIIIISFLLTGLFYFGIRAYPHRDVIPSLPDDYVCVILLLGLIVVVLFPIFISRKKK